MKRSLCNITRIMGIACAISAIFYIRKCMSCKALFVSSGIKVEYPLINLENSQVTAYVTYDGKTYMRVQYNVLTEETKVIGSIESIKLNRLIKNNITLTDADFIEMIQSSARFFVENEIAHPDEFYRQNPS
ncbi:hypothetical protein FH508_0015060 [Lysinibacillus sp. CD3-6]|uniref:hypothetical protein n=1 Tax=Lysinibacillus sp. CD3-6 TaxID=2892541 RepID=UPI001170C302|nr:hypothetical protein [Lysinibacillus sp. CD3-6]UED78772.1 hypothetical protein FH508_0015060 [Lysinibacillus sp. CD3-6]